MRSLSLSPVVLFIHPVQLTPGTKCSKIIWHDKCKKKGNTRENRLLLIFPNVDFQVHYQTSYKKIRILTHILFLKLYVFSWMTTVKSKVTSAISHRRRGDMFLSLRGMFAWKTKLRAYYMPQRSRKRMLLTFNRHPFFLDKLAWRNSFLRRNYYTFKQRYRKNRSHRCVALQWTRFLWIFLALSICPLSRDRLVIARLANRLTG